MGKSEERKGGEYWGLPVERMWISVGGTGEMDGAVTW